MYVCSMGIYIPQTHTRPREFLTTPAKSPSIKVLPVPTGLGTGWGQLAMLRFRQFPAFWPLYEGRDCDPLSVAYIVFNRFAYDCGLHLGVRLWESDHETHENAS